MPDEPDIWQVPEDEDEDDLDGPISVPPYEGEMKTHRTRSRVVRKGRSFKTGVTHHKRRF